MKSSLWIKSKLFGKSSKKIEKQFKNLLKSNMAQKKLGRLSKSQNRTSSKLAKNSKIKKIHNNDDLIIDGENMLDDNKEEQSRAHNNLNSVNQSTETLGIKKFTIHSSCSPLLPVSVPFYGRQKNVKSPERQGSKVSSIHDSVFTVQNPSYTTRVSRKKRKQNLAGWQHRKKSKE